MFAQMMCMRPKGELIKSLITTELWDLFKRNKIDPNNYVIHSGLIQINEILEDNSLSIEDRIILAEWSIGIEKQLLAAEDNMINTLSKLFEDNPVLSAHKMNFPILNPNTIQMLKDNRAKCLKLAEEELSKLI